MMEVDARKHDTPEVLPWIPPGEFIIMHVDVYPRR